MAKSKFEYVRAFETEDRLMLGCWIVVRIDGKAFHRFTDLHNYTKPNDDRGLRLLTRAAQSVMDQFTDVVIAYGQSDEYSFVLHKGTAVYNRRSSKIMTNIVSLFASSFVMMWPHFFPGQELLYPPAFDARVILYPCEDNVQDYLRWRQADCHVNNLYNTCFWKLIHGQGLSTTQAQEELKGTLSSDKNELLFSVFNVNYNNLPDLYRKGTILLREKNIPSSAEEGRDGGHMMHTSKHSPMRVNMTSVAIHTDLIGKRFWDDHPDILAPTK